jgi:hypothetical protein
LTRNVYVALSTGWSFTGNQVVADSGWPMMRRPSSVWNVPFAPRPVLTAAGTPPYRTATTKSSLASSELAGFTRSSCAPRVHVAATGPPGPESSTVMLFTVRPTRSRLNDDSSRFVRALITALPVSQFVAGLY